MTIQTTAITPTVYVWHRVGAAQGAALDNNGFTWLDGWNPRQILKSNRRDGHRATIGLELNMPGMPALRAEDYASAIGPDDLVQILLEDPNDAANNVILFLGLASDPVLNIVGSPAGNSREDVACNCVGLLSRWHDAPESQIAGSWWYDQATQAGISAAPPTINAGDAGSGVYWPGIPAVFNAGGQPNKQPIVLTQTDAAGVKFNSPSFCDAAYRQAAWWTLADVLDYLWAYHSPYNDDAASQMRYLPTDAQRQWYSTIVVPPISAEGLSALELLDVLCRQVGYRYAEFYAIDPASGDPLSYLDVWKRGIGPAKPLLLQAAGQRADALANDVNHITIQPSYASCVDNAWAIGAASQYEAVIPLMPGWRDDLLDVNAVPAPGVAGLKLDAQTPWVQKYKPGGLLWWQYHDVARVWVANEDGYYTAAPYNRGPAWDYGAALGLADPVPPRRMIALPMLSQPPSRTAYPYVLVVHYGNEWYSVLDGFTVLDDRLGVRLDMDDVGFWQLNAPGSWGGGNSNQVWLKPYWMDLVAAVNAGQVGAEWNLWPMQLFLVCAIAPGDAQIGQGQGNPATPLSRGRNFSRPDLGLRKQAVYDQAGLKLGDGGDYRDNQAELTGAAGWIADQLTDRTFCVNAGEDLINLSRDIGDTAPMLKGRDISFKRNVGPAVQFPEVVQIIWRWNAAGNSTEWSLDSTAYASTI